TYLLTTGVGIWGIDMPVAWGFAITSFVWWIGIGHAGTLISAILLLLHQKWRTSINRLAEAMTIFAVMTAGLFPLLHLGRPWFFYWLLPYPNTMRLWPQFRSALVWDVFAVGTYFFVSLLFWYMGMIPDLAMVLLLCIPLRRTYRLEAFITEDHLDVMGKLLLATSLLTSYGYLAEQSMTYYGGDPFDVHVYWYRLTDFSKFAGVVWTLFVCNSVAPQVLWSRRLRRNPAVLFIVCLIVLVGMWFERFMIIASSLSEDFLPSAFGFFKPTIWDILIYVGSIGFFFSLFLLFVRLFPIMSMSEMR